MREVAVMRNEAAERKYYIDGNTVRRMEAAPAVTRPDRRIRESRPEHVTRERRERERREREREIELRNRKRAARRNQERALRMSKSYVAFLTMAVMVFCTLPVPTPHPVGDDGAHESDIKP